MPILKRLFDFYIFANLHVGIATFSLSKITLLLYGFNENTVPLFVLFSTIASYNFIRLYQAKRHKSWFLAFVKGERKKLILLSMISLVIGLYLLSKMSFKVLAALVPLGLCTLFYVVPLEFKNKSQSNLRSIAFLKLFLISLTWAGTTVLIPLLNYDIDLGPGEFNLFMQRFLFVIAITLPFDIRDLNFDSTNLKTLPQVIGIKNTKALGLLLLMLFVGLEMFRPGSTEVDLRNNFYIALASLFFLIRAKKVQHRYYSAFFVEGIPIIWWLIYMI